MAKYKYYDFRFAWVDHDDEQYNNNNVGPARLSSML